MTAKVWDSQEALKLAAEYFNQDELAPSVFVGKYALRNDNDEILEPTPDYLHHRLANEFARIEAKYPNPISRDRIYSLLAKRKGRLGMGPIIPQGSPMSGIGNPYKLQSLSNCFVIAEPHDSYGGILFTDQEEAQIMKRRGGVGFDISPIRPKGLKTANAAGTTDGIGVFMERFSNTCREVAQGGRRGALMLTISVLHPEIETFINIKRDREKVTGANISIRVTDAFMSAVENDTDFTLQWPVDVPVTKAEITRVVRARDIWEQIVDAAWDSAEPGILFWDTAISRTPSDAYADFGHRSVSTNPCLTGDTLVAVADGRGYVSIKQLADEGKDVPVYTSDDDGNVVIRTMRNPRCTGVNVPIVKVTIEGGHTFRATPNHKLPLLDGKVVEVKDLHPGDQLTVSYRTKAKFSEVLPKYRETKSYKNFDNWSKAAALEAGVPNEFIGLDPRVQQTFMEAESQGYVTRFNQNNVEVKRACEWCKKEFWQLYATREIAFCGHSCSNLHANRVAGKNESRKASLQAMHVKKAEASRKGQLDTFTKLRFELKREPTFDDWAAECKRNNLPTRLGTKNGFKNWDDVKKNAAVHNHRVVSVESAGTDDVYNGTVDEFHNFYIGGFQEKENEQLLISTMNCGEIVLPRYDSCRLLVVDLTHFVINEFTDEAAFDFDQFDEVVQIAQRMMDDIVDLELEAVNAIIAKIKSDPEPDHVKRIELDLWERIKKVGASGRRTGLGVTGLGDALAMLNVQYGSEKSIVWTDKIYRALALGSYRSSVKMAEERGAFPLYDWKLEKDHPFLQQIMAEDEKLAKDWKKFGRRNIANTTTAPVGSVSTLTQTTSGVEPAYLLSYTRRKKINPNDKDARVDFVDKLGDKWTEFPVYHHYFKRWMDVTGKVAIEESPYHKATSNDVDWVMSVKVQASAQKWICHSISKTTNLPQSVSHDVISQVYLEAWKSGCKGMTVYRDKSRDGVLVSDTGVIVDLATRYDGCPVEEVQKLVLTGNKYRHNMPAGYLKTLSELETYLFRRLNPENRPDEIVNEHSSAVQIVENHAPRRPKELTCDIHQVKVNGESWTMLVGLLGDRPYEVFGGLSQYIEIPRKWKSGRLVKNGKKDGVTTYNLIFGPEGEETKVKDVISVFDNPTHGSFTRTISLALRHGIPIQYISEQLQKDKNSDMQSFSRVMARVLKTYIKDGTKSGESTCWSCGAKGSLIYQEKCVACVACGTSKCG